MGSGVTALLARALKRDADLLRAHLVRFGFVWMIFVALIAAHFMSLYFGAPGLHFFRLMSYLNALFITIAGASIFASTITEEKEEGTLGLLKMAGISGAGILLGKSTSRAIVCALLLLSQLPFVLLAITLGGMTVRQVVCGYAALLSYLLFIANVGLFWSVCCRRTGRAGALTALTAVVLTYGAAAFGGFLNWAASGNWNPGTSLATWLESSLLRLGDLSVMQRIDAITSPSAREPIISDQVMLHLIAAPVLFVASWVLFEAMTRNEHGPAPSRGLLPSRRARLRAMRLPRVWGNPFIWKDFNFLAGGWPMFITKLALYAAVPAGAWLMGLRGGGDEPAYVLLVMLGVELTLYASRIFAGELRWKTLPSLVLMPGALARLLYSKLAGCALGLVPVLTVLGVLYVEEYGFRAPAWDTETWVVVAEFAVFLHLTAFLSLFVRWGAAPLAVVVLMTGHLCLLSPTTGLPTFWTRWGEGIAPVIYLGVMASAGLQYLTGIRVQTVADRWE